VQLARELGATIEEMHQRISHQEYVIRRAYAVYAAAQAELEAKGKRGS
jgi:hypothetical protein